MIVQREYRNGRAEAHNQQAVPGSPPSAPSRRSGRWSSLYPSARTPLPLPPRCGLRAARSRRVVHVRQPHRPVVGAGSSCQASRQRGHNGIERHPRRSAGKMKYVFRSTALRPRFRQSGSPRPLGQHRREPGRQRPSLSQLQSVGPQVVDSIARIPEAKQLRFAPAAKPLVEANGPTERLEQRNERSVAVRGSGCRLEPSNGCPQSR